MNRTMYKHIISKTLAPFLSGRWPIYRNDLHQYLHIRLTSSLTHLDHEGRASMVDVGSKAETKRTAIATATIELGEKISNLLSTSLSEVDKKIFSQKGDVFTTAQLAGIMAAKKTSDLIPLCHNLNLSHVGVDLKLDQEKHLVRIQATASTSSKTGVEMEALTAASVAALTVYDMCKAGGKGIRITNIQLESKTGGIRGNYTRLNTSNC